MNLSIVIVNWNTREMLADCLTSVYEAADDLGIEVLVVDNASADGSAATVRERFPLVHLIENRENVGFASANNQGIRESRGRHVLLLNPDTKILPGALQILVGFMEKYDDAGAVGPMVLNPDLTLQSSVNPMPTLWREFWRLMYLDRFLPQSYYREEGWDSTVVHKVEVLQGNCLLLNRQAISDIGLLDEDYFMYTEEVDLCYRLLHAGWSLYWVPMARIIHYGGQSTKQVAREMFLELNRSKVLFFRKTRGRSGCLIYKLILLTTTLPRAVGGLLGLNSDQADKSFWPYVDLLRALPSL